MLCTFNFVSYLKILNNGITTIFSSFILGYVYNMFAGTILINNSDIINRCFLIISGVIISYLFARLSVSGKLTKLFSILKIHRTNNQIIWTDLIDKDYAMMLSVEMQNNKKYIGFLGISEEFNQRPMISLYGYKVIDIEKNITLVDNSRTANKIIVLDLGKAFNIEIIYNKQSAIFKDIDIFLSKGNFDNFITNTQDEEDSEKI